MNQQTQIDISHIPFSKYGSYLAVTSSADSIGLCVHQVQAHFGQDDALRIFFSQKDGEITDYEKECTPVTVNATPSQITINARGGCARICLTGDDGLLIEAEGLTVRFESNQCYGLCDGFGGWKAISQNNNRCIVACCTRGKIAADGPVKKGYWWDERFSFDSNACLLPDGDGRSAATLEISQTERVIQPGDCPSFEDAEAEARREWEDFLALMPPVPQRHADFARVTWYNIWSSFVRARDVYKADLMLMSKKFMTRIWSWDHCFNALALASVSADLAYNQFMAPFELQNNQGALPDGWSPNDAVHWCVTKPPIHGWCFGKLMDCCELSRGQLEAAYGGIERLTQWWLTLRDEDRDGVPAYPQGCDSGWDNATLFDSGYYVETPDLPAFLILQMNTLVRIANTLGDGEGAHKWSSRAKELTDAFMRHSMTDDGFASLLSGSHIPVSSGGCLLSLMPLVLGEQLPESLREPMLERLKRLHLTEFGLATESPQSERYEPDGYWRGPIWAPSTYLIYDGLRRMGETQLADEIARRYCDMTAFTAKGNYENFDALTGRGLRAPGYTWSASVYMLMLWEGRI